MQKTQWLANLKTLYDQILGFLDSYLQNGSVNVDFRDVELNEERIGAYSAKEMIVNIGSQTILLTPIGTMLIGAKGRVDVSGSAGKSRLVLVDEPQIVMHSQAKIRIVENHQKSERKVPVDSKHSIWTWKIAGAPPLLLLTELNKDNFYQLLMEVSNS